MHLKTNTQKATHGRSAIQTNVVFCHCDVNGPGRDPTPDGQEESLPRLSRQLSAISHIFQRAFQQNMERNGVKSQISRSVSGNLMCGSIFHRFQSQKGFKTAVVEVHLLAFAQSINITRVCG